MQFHEKKMDLFDFTSFLAWPFLNFLARCVRVFDKDIKIKIKTLTAHAIWEHVSKFGLKTKHFDNKTRIAQENC